MQKIKDIYHVVAVAQNGVIGKENKLPWHFSADMKFFKSLTTGNTVIMGRKTYESIGRPLPNRQNIIISRTPKKAEGVDWVCSVEDAIKTVSEDRKAFIIGGAEIYRQTIDKIAGIYLTYIHQNYEGDAIYPGIPAGFTEVSRETLQEKSSCQTAGGQENPLIEIIFYKAPVR